jgi:hypothetical protein
MLVLMMTGSLYGRTSDSRGVEACDRSHGMLLS